MTKIETIASLTTWVLMNAFFVVLAVQPLSTLAIA